MIKRHIGWPKPKPPAPLPWLAGSFIPTTGPANFSTNDLKKNVLELDYGRESDVERAQRHLLFFLSNMEWVSEEKAVAERDGNIVGFDPNFPAGTAPGQRKSALA